MKKRFHLSTILSVTTGFLLCPIEELYKIFEHVTGKPGVTTMALAYMADPIKESLLKQFPELAEVDIELLKGRLAQTQPADEKETICEEWVMKIAENYDDEYLEVELDAATGNDDLIRDQIEKLLG